ncbi:MAG: hypothetical protein FJ102_11670 [Deltaproteobacteria bacterium]|nr:hypothetical protein [Deltaproteobacteria bacterium]
MVMLVLGAWGQEAPRPVLGIGIGLRGDEDSAGFVASTRVRVSETFLVEPAFLVTYSESEGHYDHDADPDQDDTATTASYLRALPQFGFRGRVARRGRVSGWLTAQVTASYYDKVSAVASWPGDAESSDDDSLSRLAERTLSMAGGAGFASELFLAPEVALSADVGASLVFAGWLWGVEEASALNEEGTARDESTYRYDYASLGLGFDPYAQLAVHLYY